MGLGGFQLDENPDLVVWDRHLRLSPVCKTQYIVSQYCLALTVTSSSAQTKWGLSIETVFLRLILHNLFIEVWLSRNLHKCHWREIYISNLF